MKINFDQKIEKLKSKLNIWTSRDLTIFGRSCIVNTLGLSLASLVVFPENVIKTIEQLVSNFIWRGRKAKVKRQTLINKTEDGGIGLIDIRSKVKGGVTRCNFPCSKSRNAVARHAARSLLLHEPRCYTVQHSSCSLQRFEFLEEKRLGQLACATRILARAWREI